MGDQCINVILVTVTLLKITYEQHIVRCVSVTDTGLGLSEPTFNLSEAQTAYSGSAYFHCETTLLAKEYGLQKTQPRKFRCACGPKMKDRSRGTPNKTARTP